jgi:ElaB/YqjD/DUF883 family membrane-anchored ribosome-binding protein
MSATIDTSTDNKINTAREGVTQINRDLRADAHTAIDKVADKVPAVTDRLATSAHNGVDKVADTVENSSVSLSERAKQFSASYKEYAETGREYVRNKPAISVLIAAAAGYGLSKLLSSRK